MVWVPHTLERLSAIVGSFFLAYKDPVSWKPLGWIMLAKPLPQPVMVGMSFTPVLKRSLNCVPSAAGSTLLGFSKEFGRLRYVQVKTNSLVRVGLNTFVRLAEIESDSFPAIRRVGYGTVGVGRHHSVSVKYAVSRWRL